MNCPNCGEEISNNETTCLICGYEFDSSMSNQVSHSNTLGVDDHNTPTKSSNVTLKIIICILAALLIGMIAVIAYVLMNSNSPSVSNNNTDSTCVSENLNGTIMESDGTHSETTNLTSFIDESSSESIPQTEETKSETTLSSETNSETHSESLSETQNNATSSDHTLAVYTKLLSENCMPYTLYDIDGNKEYEIILKESWHGEVYENVIYHFYTFHNDELIKLGQYHFDYPMYLTTVYDVLHFAEDGMDTYISEIRMIDNQIFVGESEICMDTSEDVFFYDYKDKSMLNYIIAGTN